MARFHPQRGAGSSFCAAKAASAGRRRAESSAHSVNLPPSPSALCAALQRCCVRRGRALTAAPELLANSLAFPVVTSTEQAKPPTKAAPARLMAEDQMSSSPSVMEEPGRVMEELGRVMEELGRLMEEPGRLIEEPGR